MENKENKNAENTAKKDKSKTEDFVENVKESAKKTAEKVKEGAKEIVKEIDDSTKEFQQEAKSTTGEFAQGAKEAYQDLTSNKENKKILVGILAILFGAFGVHKFVLGYTKEGLIMIAATFVLGILSFGLLVWLVGLIGFIEGIIYLTKSDDEFYQTYQVNKKAWF
jgi:TM2 domain-containing membrane protein YozV